MVPSSTYFTNRFNYLRIDLVTRPASVLIMDFGFRYPDSAYPENINRNMEVVL